MSLKFLDYVVSCTVRKQNTVAKFAESMREGLSLNEVVKNFRISNLQIYII